MERLYDVYVWRWGILGPGCWVLRVGGVSERFALRYYRWRIYLTERPDPGYVAPFRAIVVPSEVLP